MPTHLPFRSFDRLLLSQDGGLPGIPGSGPSQPQPTPPSLEKQPAPLPGTQPLPGSELPSPPAPPGGPLFQQPAPIPPVPAGGGTFELSGWWRRVGATIIDSLILAIPYFVIVFAILGVSFNGDGDAGNGGLSVGAILVTTLAWVVLWFVYAPYLMLKTNGATIGKKATGIRVVRTDGAPMTFGFAMIREVLVKAFAVGLVSNLTLGLAGLLNYLWPLWDSEHRAGHDMICKTRVVRD